MIVLKLNVLASEKERKRILEDLKMQFNNEKIVLLPNYIDVEPTNEKQNSETPVAELVHNCPNCGAPITGNKCDYCGTVFKVDETDFETIPIYADNFPFMTVKRRVET